MQKTFTLFTLFLLAAFGLQAQIIISDDDLQGDQTYNWTNDNVYQLDGFVYLEAGGVLNIEAGTRIEGLPENDNDEVGTLIITNGAQIFAEGTAAEPIVFSGSQIDDVNDPVDIFRGSWGGVIVLGDANVGDENSMGFANIEGIEAEARTQFGGDNDEDNSGVLRYVSIRFGGFPLSPNNEINGLTLGGVGSGTTIEHIEIFANDDDGVEFFGGTVDLKYGVVAYCGDDSYDTDMAWSGRGQFWFSLQDPEQTGGSSPNGGEHDGSEDPNDATGGPVQTVFNATYIGRGENAQIAGDNNALTIKDNAAISYNNSIFTEFDDFAVSMQDGAADRYVANEFDLLNNIFFNISGDALGNPIQLDGNDATLTTVALAFATDGNDVVDPELARVNFTPSTDGGADGNGVDPRPGFFSPARTGAADAPAGDDFFESTTYRGAFDPTDELWAAWTLSYQRGLIVETLNVNTIDFGRNEDGVKVLVSPNPTADLVALSIELPAATQADAMIYDQFGRNIAQFDLGQLQAGSNQPTINLGELVSGNYFIVLNTKFGAVSQRVTVAK
ncbi:hypothetical protein CEQ90_05605 [Lewinellaceae bacterium SD302]|nr:hypothetical protein CEQ90_05605 [Lewinellaceae bacterium SD302]